MKYQEIQSKDDSELRVLAERTRDKIRALRFDISLRNIKNHRQHRKEKKVLARVLTALSDRARQ